MTINSSNIDVKLYVNESLEMDGTLSIYRDLLMLHSPYMSAQWPIDETGIHLTRQTNHIIKLGFYSAVSVWSYQSIYFDASCYDIIYEFLNTYGFLMPKNNGL